MFIKAQLWERKYGDLKDMPFREKFVEENSTIEFESVFEFKGKQAELFSFLFMAHKYGCTVKFINEELTIPPKAEMIDKMALSIYCLLYKHPKIIEDYTKWIFNKYKNEQQPQI